MWNVSRNKGRIAFVWLIVLCGLLAACVPQQIETMPTLAAIPSDTATLRPTITKTRTPTLTRTNTLTYTPTPTKTYTPSVTFTASISPVPTLTKPPSYTPSFTPTNTPIPSATFTPSNTFTPTLTRTPTLTFTPTVIPEIIFFTSDLVNIPAGGQTTLRWQTNNSPVVTLEQINAQGQITASFSVSSTGTQIVSVTTALGNKITYRLTAKNGRNITTRALSINVLCGSPWFYNPAPGACPLEAPVRTTLIFQSFERGVAFYVPTTRTVYLLSNGDNNRVNAYPMDWDYSPLPTLSPPSGLLQPTGEIGYIFAKKAWSDGQPIVNLLGWATLPQQGYESVVQRGTPTDVYIRRPDGAVYRLALAGIGKWTVVGTVP